MYPTTPNDRNDYPILLASSMERNQPIRPCVLPLASLVAKHDHLPQRAFPLDLALPDQLRAHDGFLAGAEARMQVPQVRPAVFVRDREDVLLWCERGVD